MLTLKPQRGVIVWGAGLNQRAWIADARARGYVVVLRAGCATFH